MPCIHAQPYLYAFLTLGNTYLTGRMQIERSLEHGNDTVVPSVNIALYNTKPVSQVWGAWVHEWKLLQCQCMCGWTYASKRNYCSANAWVLDHMHTEYNISEVVVGSPIEMYTNRKVTRRSPNAVKLSWECGESSSKHVRTANSDGPTMGAMQ